VSALSSPADALARYPTLVAMMRDGSLKDVTEQPRSRTRRPEAKARQADPQTAKAAAIAAAPNAANAKTKLLYAFAHAPDGLTASGASEQSGVFYATASTRVTELERDGMLKRTGRTRRTSHGYALEQGIDVPRDHPYVDTLVDLLDLFPPEKALSNVNTDDFRDFCRDQGSEHAAERRRAA
jgi:hypothetical protein